MPSLGIGRGSFFAVLLVFFIPSPHGIQNGFQALAEFGQRILNSRQNHGIDLAVDKSASTIARS